MSDKKQCIDRSCVPEDKLVRRCAECGRVICEYDVGAVGAIVNFEESFEDMAVIDQVEMLHQKEHGYPLEGKRGFWVRKALRLKRQETGRLQEKIDKLEKIISSVLNHIELECGDCTSSMGECEGNCTIRDIENILKCKNSELLKE